MAILISTCGIVSADENTFTGQAQNGHLVVDQKLTDVSVTYNVQSETYTIYYPSIIQFSTLDAVVSDYVQISKATLKPGITLNVTVSSKHNWKLIEHDVTLPGGSHPYLPYMMQYWFNGADNPTPVVSESQDPAEPKKISIMTFDSGLSERRTDLEFSIVGETTVFGSYEDLLTFEVSVEGR